MSRSRFDRRIGTWARCGLTLLELVVALGILAVLSTVAVRALDPLADQVRYETTQRILEELRVATVGDPQSQLSNGKRFVSGFIADTGALPTDLDDFTTLPSGLIAHASQAFDSDRDTVNDLTLSSGWRGPYIRLGVGVSGPVDGWGRAPLIDPDGGDFDFVSLGSDNDSVAPEDSYRANLSATIPSTTFTSDVVFRLFAIDGTTGTRIDPAVTGTQQLGVLFYAVNANGGTTGAVQELTLPIAGVGTFEATQSDVIHGHAAARGFLWDDVDLDQALDAGESIIASSYVHYFTVTSDADLRIEMELR